jgi:general secretion pathway protein H
LSTNRPRRGTAGFTLIEIMVVVLITGISAGLIYANIDGDPRRNIQREAKLLAGALEHAAALAQWRHQTLGVSAEGRTYRFWWRDPDDRWKPYVEDEVLAAHALPDGVSVMPTTYAGTPVPPDAILPFRPSGRNEPYVLVLASPGGRVVVAGDPLNRVSYSAVQAESGTPN